MAHLHEDFVRCPNCNCATFEERVLTSISKSNAPRSEKDIKLRPSREVPVAFVYYCAQCSIELQL